MKIEAYNPMHLIPENNITSIEKPDHDFMHFLTEKISDTNEKLLAADNSLQDLAKGHAQSLHQVMLTMQEAKLSFQFLEQIRNRVMTAYQEILREQI